MEVTVIGAGLAGCEAALWLACQGLRVRLVEQKPEKFSPAHQRPGFAELVCSNSLKAERLGSAAGLLKAEMRLLGSSLLPVADGCRVAAGGALAVDRDAFSAGVTQLVVSHPGIVVERREQPGLDAFAKEGSAPVLVASGPLTQGTLAQDIARRAGDGMLSFYDAAAPIVTVDSLDMDKVFAASRYGRGDDDYLNCPFDKAGYEAFYEALRTAETAPLHSFDARDGADGEAAGAAPTVYEGCMPVEVMAQRGPDTLRYGPMRPVGLRDPRTGHRPWANVQLRRENAGGSLYNLVGFQTNLKFPEQKRVFGMIPGLADAEFARYGVMHRNTFLNSPKVLGENFALKSCGNIFFAGQITGFEGYMESAACGLLAARAMLAQMRGADYTAPPPQTMCGALNRYMITENKNFQPMGANMGLLPPLREPVRDKRLRYEMLAEHALEGMKAWEGL